MRHIELCYAMHWMSDTLSAPAMLNFIAEAMSHQHQQHFASRAYNWLDTQLGVTFHCHYFWTRTTNLQNRTVEVARLYEPTNSNFLVTWAQFHGTAYHRMMCLRSPVKRTNLWVASAKLRGKQRHEFGPWGWLVFGSNQVYQATRNAQWKRTIINSVVTEQRPCAARHHDEGDAVP